MYSTTFALAAILSVAFVNLFLGFAFASLIGRGPRRWRDADQAITVRYFSTGLLLPGTLLPGRRSKTESAPATKADSPASAASAKTSAAAHTTSKKETRASTATASPASPVDKPAAASPPFPATATVPSSLNPSPRLVLTPKDQPDEPLDEPIEESLQRQLTAWLAHEQRIETPSLCGISAVIRGPSADSAVVGAVMKAIRSKMAAQLRKDRRILHPHENQLIWFAADTHPDDGLMPISRIRLLLEKTRFLVGATPLTVEMATALMSVNAGDTPATLLRRMQQTLAYALEKGAGSVCVELGSGPTLVDPVPMDVDASECVVG